MLGLMQDWPLLCHRIIDHAAIYHGERKVITRSVEGPIHTTNYTEIRTRALKVAQRLEKDGIKLGDRVATLAWNTWRHLEVWYGILGLGAITTPSIHACFPIRSHGLSIMPVTELCSPTSRSSRFSKRSQTSCRLSSAISSSPMRLTCRRRH